MDIKTSDEELRIKIAEICGAKWQFDYANDLNAMHEAEKKIPNKLWPDYCFNVICAMDAATRKEDSYMLVISATARQRAEAFIITFKKVTETRMGPKSY